MPYFTAVYGTALNVYKQLAVDSISTRGMTKFDNTRYSHYRGVRWLVLLRESFHFPFMLAILLRARKRWPDIQLIHVNESVYIIPALIAKRLFKVPLIVHVRSLNQIDQGSLRTRWLTRTSKKNADAIVAINENTRATLSLELPVEVIQNSFTANLAPRPDAHIVAKLDKLRDGSLKVGFVGNLHHSNGLFDILEAAKLIRAAGRDVEFLIVGGVTIEDKGLKAWALALAGLAQNVQADLVAQVERDSLGDSFHLLGPTYDIKCVYDRLDVLLFPSHYDAPGRPVFEAAFSAVPSIVSVHKPYSDTLVDGETGIAIPAKDPAALARAILYFVDHPEEVTRMGENARKLADANFYPTINAKKLLSAYERALRATVRADAARQDLNDTLPKK
jgi:glycosyltransferase involved in cell wall biosynthesis